MDKKQSIKNNIALGVAILGLLMASTFASYAYFSSKFDEGDGLTLDTTIVDAPVFSAYTLDPLELSVNGSDMVTPSTTAVKSDVGDIIVTLSSPVDDFESSCTYNIDLVWDTEDQYSVPSGTFTSEYKYEISLSGTQTVNGDTTGKTSPVTSLNETNLTDFNWEGTVGEIGRKATIIEGAQIFSNSTSATTATWNFTVSFYALPFSQSSITGKTYGAHLIVTNVLC